MKREWKRERERERETEEEEKARGEKRAKQRREKGSRRATRATKSQTTLSTSPKSHQRMGWKRGERDVLISCDATGQLIAMRCMDDVAEFLF